MLTCIAHLIQAARWNVNPHRVPSPHTRSRIPPDGELSQPLGRCRVRRRRPPRHLPPCPGPTPTAIATQTPRRLPPSPHSHSHTHSQSPLEIPSPHARCFRGASATWLRRRSPSPSPHAHTHTHTHTHALALALAPAFAFALAESPRHRVLALADILRPGLAADRRSPSCARMRTHIRIRIRRPPAT